MRSCLLLAFGFLLAATSAQAADPRIIAVPEQAQAPQQAQAPVPAPSQPPAPGAGEPGGPPQAEPGAAQQPPEAKHRGTEQSPLVVKVPPAPTVDPQGGNERNQSDEKPSTDWGMTVFTGLLALFGFLQLFVFGPWQLRRTIVTMRGIAGSQGEDMKASIAEAARAASAMQEQAKLMQEAVAATRTAAEAAQEGSRISQETFIQTYRPRLRVRNVVVKPAQVPGYLPELFHPLELISGHIQVVNIGGSPAHIREAHCEVFWCNLPLPMEPPYAGKPSNKEVLSSLQAGEARPIAFESETRMSEREWDGVREGRGWSLYVLGWIRYADDLRFERRMHFCRRYDPAQRRFFRVEDTDYENEE